MKRSGNVKDDKYNNNFPPNNPPDIPPSFPPDLTFDPPSQIHLLLLALLHGLVLFHFLLLLHFLPFLFLHLLLSLPLSLYFLTTTQLLLKKLLIDFDSKIRGPQKPRIILLAEVDEIPKAEKKQSINLLHFNQLFPDA